MPTPRRADERAAACPACRSGPVLLEERQISDIYVGQPGPNGVSNWMRPVRRQTPRGETIAMAVCTKCGGRWKGGQFQAVWQAAGGPVMA